MVLNTVLAKLFSKLCHKQNFLKMLFAIWQIFKTNKHEVFPGSYFPVFGLNTGKYGPEKTPYLDTFYAVSAFLTVTIEKTESFTNKLKVVLRFS